MTGALLLLALANAPLPPGATLDGRVPTQAEGVAAPARLTDGSWEFDGDGWQAPGAVELPPGRFVEWDLGRSEAIAGAALQADNNDQYVLSLSEDGRAFTPLWQADPKPGPGLQTRWTGQLHGRGRFLRLSAQGGDGRCSVSEVTVFSSRAQAWGWWLRRRLPSNPLDVAWGLGLLATALVLTLTGRRSRRPVIWAGALILVGLAGWLVVRSWNGAAGVDAPRLNWIRAVVAAAAFVAVLRERLFSRTHPAHPGLALGVLGTTAGLALLCFLNFGHPQFSDAGAGRPTFLHHYDMRTYFPIAKYFPELRFDGVYAASAMVIAEERGGPEAIAAVGLRDLRTHDLTTVGAAKEHLLAVRARFTPERWAQFVKDMGYFRRAMGDGGFLGSMGDHGGNATPVWFLGARLAFARLPASDFALWLGVALDVALMLLAFAALAWAFGARTALVAITVFGAMDFYLFGTNWFGAALRHDWLALWGLGLAALKKERFTLAGGLLAASALIRAFPALTFAALAIPAGWDALASLVTRTFSLRAWLTRQRGLLRVALGAAVTGGALVAASVAVFGAGAWVEWFHKVALLNAGNHVNNLSVKTHLSTSPLMWGLTATAVCVLVALVARRAPPFEAAAWGIVLLPIVFNPANYYLHSVFLLVVLAGAPERGAPVRVPWVWLTLLAMCIGSYFTSLTRDLGLHFGADTVVLVTALGCLLVIKGVGSLRRAPAPRPAEAPAASGPAPTALIAA